MYKFDGKEIQALCERRLELDCIDMELVGGQSKSEQCYRGPGCITQKSDYGFLIKIYVSEPLKFGRDSFDQNFLPGTLYGRDNLYRLTAVDNSGRKWQADGILPDRDGCVDGKGYVVTGDCYEIVAEDETDREVSKASLEFTAFAKIKYPCNETSEIITTIAGKKSHLLGRRDTAQFDACDMKYLMRQYEGELKLKVISETKSFKPHVEARITEALCFVLAEEVPWSVVYRREGKCEKLTLRSPRNNVGKSRLYPPIRISGMGNVKIWNLFNLFLAYTIDYSDEEESIPTVSHQLHAVLCAARGSIEAEAVILSIAIESILDEYVKDCDYPDVETKREIDSLLKYIRNWGGNKNMIARAGGAIGSLKSARSSDRLNMLETKGAVTKEQSKNWRKLRNSVTHGKWPKGDIQQFVDFCAKDTVLLYHLIFHLIGYQGIYTDYGTHGYPPCEYPKKSVDS